MKKFKFLIIEDGEWKPILDILIELFNIREDIEYLTEILDSRGLRGFSCGNIMIYLCGNASNAWKILESNEIDIAIIDAELPINDEENIGAISMLIGNNTHNLPTQEKIKKLGVESKLETAGLWLWRYALDKQMGTKIIIYTGHKDIAKFLDVFRTSENFRFVPKGELSLSVIKELFYSCRIAELKKIGFLNIISKLEVYMNNPEDITSLKSSITDYSPWNLMHLYPDLTFSDPIMVREKIYHDISTFSIPVALAECFNSQTFSILTGHGDWNFEKPLTIFKQFERNRPEQYLRLPESLKEFVFKVIRECSQMNSATSANNYFHNEARLYLCELADYFKKFETINLINNHTMRKDCFLYCIKSDVYTSLNWILEIYHPCANSSIEMNLLGENKLELMLKFSSNDDNFFTAKGISDSFSNYPNVTTSGIKCAIGNWLGYGSFKVNLSTSNGTRLIKDIIPGGVILDNKDNENIIQLTIGPFINAQ